MSTGKTDIAIDDAVAHWERLSKYKTVAEVEKEGFHSEECSLCELFFDNRCGGCPVAERTGVPYCEKSPYDRAQEELYKFIDGLRKTFPRKAVLAELNFLKSLRKEKQIPEDPENETL